MRSHNHYVSFLKLHNYVQKLHINFITKHNKNYIYLQKKAVSMRSMVAWNDFNISTMKLKQVGSQNSIINA